MEDINKKNMEIYRKGAIKRMAKFNTSELDFTIIVRSSRPSIRVVGEGCVCTIIINEVHYDKNKDVFTLKYETYNTRSKNKLHEDDFSYSMCDFVFNEVLNYINISVYKKI
jgi:hypothetical protein